MRLQQPFLAESGEFHLGDRQAALPELKTRLKMLSGALEMALVIGQSR